MVSPSAFFPQDGFQEPQVWVLGPFRCFSYCLLQLCPQELAYWIYLCPA